MARRKSFDGRALLKTQIETLKEEITTLRQLREHDMETIAELRREVVNDEVMYKRLDNQHRAATQPPIQHRRVVRTLIIDGDPEWVALTLKRSLAPGTTLMGGLGHANRVTVHPVSDETTACFGHRMNGHTASQTISSLANDVERRKRELRNEEPS